MEKHRNSKSTKRYIGLLITLFITINSLFAASWSSLRIKPEKEYCFTGETCLFTLEIPGVLPARVNATVQSTPQNVTIESWYKEEYIENGQRGTIIKLNFRFSKAGTYTIPSLATRIDWWSYSIKFLPITVYDNPILLQPNLTTDIPKNLEVGKPTTFTIYGKFFNELVNINYDLDTKMILEKSKDLKSLPYHIGTFSTENYPLAEFTIIPLEEGTFSLPQIFGVFRNYAGNTVNIFLEEKTLKVTKSTNQATSSWEQNTQLFEENFSASFPEAFILEDDNGTSVQMDKSKVVYETLEKELSQKSILTICTIVFFILLIIFLTLVFIFSSFKKKSLVVTFLCLTLVFLVLSVYFFVITHKQEGISLGSSVKTVPEENANTVMQLSMGDKILILDSISNWYSIETEDNRRGWILNSDCVLIQKEELEKFSQNN
jgi:hypothetical protein